MRRLRLERVCAALLLQWFAFITGAPSAVHSCPVHDSATTATRAESHDTHSHGQSDRDGSDGPCTCIGDCSTGGVAKGIPTARATIVLAAPARVTTALLAPNSPALIAPAFLLPFANGPPGARRVA